MRAKGIHEGNRKDSQIELALKLVSDLEKGVDFESAGWLPVPADVEKKLMASGCCEKSERGIRLLLSCPPAVGDDYLDGYLADARAAVSVLDEIREVFGGKKLQIGAVCAGLAEMLASSNFPVLPQAMLEKGFGPGSWFVRAVSSVPDLAVILVAKVSGEDLTEKLPVMKCKDSSQVMEVLMWEKVSEAFDWITLRDLGVLWYAHLLATKKGVSHETNMLLVQTETRKMLKSNSDPSLEEAIQKLDELTIFEFGGERNPVADWRRIFRLPPWWL